MQANKFLTKYAKYLTIMAVMFGALSSVFGTIITAPPLVITFLRLALSLPFFAILCISKEQGRKELKSLKVKDYIWCLFSGMFLFGNFFFWFTALKNTTIASGSVFGSFSPLVVLFITLFIYKRKVGIKQILAIIVALAGCSVMAGIDLSEMSGHMFGNLSAFISSVSMGTYLAMGDSMKKKISGTTYVFLVFTGCFISAGIGCLISGTPILGYPPVDYLYIFAMAIFCQIGCHAMYNIVIGYVPSIYVSTWTTADPVFSTAFGLIFIKQIPKAYELIGCIIVVCSLVYYNIQEAKAEKERNEL